MEGHDVCPFQQFLQGYLLIDSRVGDGASVVGQNGAAEGLAEGGYLFADGAGAHDAHGLSPQKTPPPGRPWCRHFGSAPRSGGRSAAAESIRDYDGMNR